MTPETQEGIQRFFDWFRLRLSNIRWLEEQYTPPNPTTNELSADRHVLLLATLDSLANHWDATFNHPFVTAKGKTKRMRHGKRMGEFLQAHGGHAAFARCSAPDLINREAQEKRPLYFGKVLRNTAHHVIDWKSDPTLVDVLKDHPQSKSGVDADWIRKSRFGEIIYHELRNSWIHELQGAGRLGVGVAFRDKVEPWYEWYFVRPGIDDGERRPVIPWRFLVATLEHSINNFEAQCIAASVAPEPMVRE